MPTTQLRSPVPKIGKPLAMPPRVVDEISYVVVMEWEAPESR